MITACAPPLGPAPGLTAHDLLDPWIDSSFKGFPHRQPALRRSHIASQGWNVLADDLPLPIALLRQRALKHNLHWMQSVVDRAGIAFAPHGKTTLSPQLFQAQLQAGAWGISFATVGQLALGVCSGVRRAVIANQVLHPADITHLVQLLDEHTDLQVMFLLDSAAQLDCIAHCAPNRPLDVLLELGLQGGRTGCRDQATALALARQAHASPFVRLVGVECYEGLWTQGDSAADCALTHSLITRMRQLVLACDADNLFEGPEIVLSAGGSAVFDQVAAGLGQAFAQAPALRRPTRALLRAGCYITHDHGHYQRLGALANHRMGCAAGLEAALEVWALVQSLPEPGLALLAVGKRDLSFDMGLPIPIATCAQGSRSPQPCPASWSIRALNDQHAYLQLGADPTAHPLRVGDKVALGISHPCTTFDKWRWMPVVDEHLTVVDAITTHF